MDDFARFAIDLERMPAKTVRQGRGMTAKKLDAAANNAKDRAKAAWTPGPGRSAETIRARMTSDKSQLAGYVLADGEGVFFNEHGDGHRPPNPIVRESVVEQFDSWLDELGGIASSP